MRAQTYLLAAAALAASVGADSQTGSPPPSTGGDLVTTVAAYSARYGNPTPYTLIVSDRGKGPSDLRGLRNFRVVLPGILYRAGANNAYRAAGVRDNRNPLPPEGLDNICRQGFGDAVYLYSKNFEPATRSCSAGYPNTLGYVSWTPYSSAATVRRLLEKVHAHIEGPDHRPILAHCWNGWHASGYASAIALRQFCGLNGAQAVRYWDATAVSLGAKGDAAIHERLNGFTPYPDLKISDAHRRLLCGAYS